MLHDIIWKSKSKNVILTDTLWLTKWPITKYMMKNKCKLNFLLFAGNHFTVAFFLAVLLSAVSTQPGKTDWWLDPCATQLSQMRHPRSAGTRQLSISINYMNDLRKKLTSIHPNVRFLLTMKYFKTHKHSSFC